MTDARATPRLSRTGDRGFVLVAVLWILAALATFASVYSIYVSNTAAAAAVRDDALVAHGLATAAVELAALRFVSVPKEKRPTRGEVTFRMGKASIVAVFEDEAARIDLNGASRELLAGLFGVLGAQPEAAGDFADRIIAWRSPASGGEGAAALHEQAGLDYGPRGGPFVHVEEVWRVAGLPPALVAAALPHLTVYSGRSEVNVADADPVVRAALAGAATRDDGEGGAEGQVAAASGTTVEGGDAVRVSVGIAFDSGRRRSAEAVILLRDFDGDPYRVLTWREDVDTPARTPSMPKAPMPGPPARQEAKP